MGYLYYGNSTDAIQLPDRELAHLKMLASTKLRRSESFTVSWTKTDGSDGRSTIWIHASIPLRFELDHNQTLDRRYLEEMAHAANTSAGILIDLATEAAPVAAPVAVAADRDVPQRDLRRAA